MTSRRARSAVLPLLLSALLALAALAPTAAQARRAEPDKTQATSSEQARAALTRAQGVLAGRLRGDATMALRDLAMSRSELSGADRAAADRVLGRPSDPGDEDPYDGNPVTTTCSATVCVHYTTTGSEASTPQLAAATLAEATAVHDRYVAAGYRAPKSDGTDGGNALPDVYLAQIGDRGLYGYCASEDEVPEGGPYDVSAYCVVDNDYSPAEFGTHNTPLENLQVTIAHEYFHAVQFAYDYYEDRWLYEATAAWVEDIIYDDVDDNLGYLRYSPLTYPSASMDQTNENGFHYGIWTFFRFLSERYPTAQAGMPTIVRDIIRRLDGAAGGPDAYSWQAVDQVLRARGSSAAAAFALFADGNRRPAKTYSEGAANRYPQAPLGKFRFKSGWNITTIDHLASSTARFNTRPRGSKLKLTVDLAARATSPAAIVSVYLRSGAVRTSAISLNSAGNGAKTVPFARRKVKGVEVTLVNGSGRFRSCFSFQTPFSCGGAIPVDDNLVAKVSARILS